MKKHFKRIVVAVVLVIATAVLATAITNWSIVRLIFFGGSKVHETVPPKLPPVIVRPAILVFSKTNGFRHIDAIPAANRLFAGMAKARGWGYFQTENGATFRPDILARFDAVVFNNVSGDVFDAGQREALKAFVERGGGFVAIHGSGGDGEYDWKWYGETLIGAKFIGHPMFPQFQQAVVRVENGSHPATRSLPGTWIRSDEWYSFARSPRLTGANVLLTVDERTYPNRKSFGIDLSMGADHPVAWWHCVGRGRALYSALGHAAEAYDEPGYRAMLEGAVSWALRLDGAGCDSEKAETGR